MLKSGLERLKRAGIGDPERNLEIMLEKALGLNRLELHLERNRIVSDAEIAALDGFITRKLKGEPVQYIVGESEFYGLPFKIDPRVLIPRPETEILVETALELIVSMNRPEVLDLGAGSGAIAVALAAYSDCRILAVDVSTEAVELASENCSLNGVEGKVELAALDMTAADFISRMDRKFDLIVSNPPYISQEEIAGLDPMIRDYEPMAALTDGADGLEFYRLMTRIIPELCSGGGWGVFEVAANRADEAALILSQCMEEINLIDDLAGKPRVVKGRCSLA